MITGGIGVCHLFVDETMETEAALEVIVNAKKQRPSACNSLETLLIHENIMAEFLPQFCQRMSREGISLHADENIIAELRRYQADVLPVAAGEYDDEWLSLDLNVKAVASLDDAVAHIREHGTQHSDGILSRSLKNAQDFINKVDSSAVYVNASTRFTDGAQFGLGAEVAVSTQKLHARGPMGLEALTTYKWVAWGRIRFVSDTAALAFITSD